MDSSFLRQEFLDFFEKRGHKIVPPASLIPDDSSVLFTTAGMQQFKPYFLGEKSPYGDKAVSCQKCLRTSDIEKVGDESHLTFFEMLGNFSFGGYFKQEAIEMAMEFLTKNCKLSQDKLWFTYFKGEKDLPKDTETKKILLDFGIPKQKILGFGKDENFWGPTGDKGPCGPTAEIHYDLTGKPCEKGDQCLPNCKCGRFVELWNLVFNEFYQDKEAKLLAIEEKGGSKGVDTGLGLERLAMACQNKIDVFETDLFEPLIKIIGKKSYNKESRIISDHIQASCFLISEGIMPSNLDKGYVLRRLLRKAIRCKRVLRVSDTLLIDLAKKVIEIYKDIYPELGFKQEDILTVLRKEEEDFGKALDRGLVQFEKLLAVKKAEEMITGKEAFNLFETYGFPLELVQELAKEKGFSVDEQGFQKALDEHQEISRAGKEKKFGGIGKDAESKEAVKLHTATHLLHSALRKILGDNVQQMGSDITPERLRFDFSFDRKLAEKEVQEIEDLVNQKIKENLKIEKEEMSLEKALKSGALSFFKEKYPDIVNVYSIDSFSKEICAGPHTTRTGELGSFKIIKQESVGSGIRRIKAILKELVNEGEQSEA